MLKVFYAVNINNQEKRVSIANDENRMGVFQVFVEDRFIGDLYHRLGQWNIDDSDVSHDDVQVLGRLAKTIG